MITPTKIRLYIAAALLTVAMPTTAIAAVTGEITLAKSEYQSGKGDFAGSLTWGNCPDTCSWVPIVVVQPNLPYYSCEGDEYRDGDPNTINLWSSNPKYTNDTVSFDLKNYPILSGVSSQLVCLEYAANNTFQDPICVAQAQALNQDPSSCPYFHKLVEGVAASKVIDVGPPPPPTSTSTAPPPVAPVTSTATPKTTTQKKPCLGLKGKKLKQCKAVQSCKKKFKKGKRQRACLNKAQAKR